MSEVFSCLCFELSSFGISCEDFGFPLFGKAEN
jgi:hypothetical protein